MARSDKYIIGTSGFSFADWVGTFYPPGTKPAGMFDQYARHFSMVELNFTFYAMPGERTFQALLARAPADFEFWVKVNKQITHEGNLQPAPAFLAACQPLAAAGKLAGLILQFPQSFKRTVANRKYLADAIKALSSSSLLSVSASPPLPVSPSSSVSASPPLPISPSSSVSPSPPLPVSPSSSVSASPPLPVSPSSSLAVEFRDRSWEHPAVFDGLRRQGVTLVVPDAPPIGGLFRPRPTATSRIAYLRLHSRDAGKWYAGMAERYDYNYSDAELSEIVQQWRPVEAEVDRIYAMFNNCHRGQAAHNAEQFRRILGQIT